MTTTDATVKSFRDFGVAPEIADALEAKGITTPFPIQELTLPLALSGADLIGQARTGTGKTLAFGIPLLQRLDPSSRETQALVIVPTRELCLQVHGDLTQAGAQRGVDVVAAYGGKAIDPQSEAIAAGAQVVVGTPGRLLDLVRRGVLRLGTVSGLVLDEADEMLDLGFLPDVEQLIEACATPRQTLLFSATMPSAVVALARRYMHKPTFLRAEVEEPRIAPATQQYFFSCHRMDKPAVLARILQTPDRGLCVVFTRTKRMADILAEELRDRGVSAQPIHSDLRQEARERALAKFRKGTIDVLVATEVAARGLDISDVTHVVNYDCPDDEKMYLHRIGRTGRAGAAGVAITFAVWNELARMEVIKKALEIDEPTHEVFSTSPILGELFDLPAEAARRPAPPTEKADESDRDADADAGRGRRDRSGDDEDGSRRKRRRGGRRGGRGRGKGGEEADRRDDADQARGRTSEPSVAAPAVEAPAVEAPAGGRRAQRDEHRDTERDDESTRVRVRRRTVRTAPADDVAADVATRRRESGDPDVEPADATLEDVVEPAAGGDAFESGERRVRTRTRTRTRSRDVGDDTDAGTSAEDEEASADGREQEGRSRSRRGGTSRGGGRGGGRAAAADETDDEAGDDTGRSSSRSGGRSSSRRSSTRSGDDRTSTRSGDDRTSTRSGDDRASTRSGGGRSSSRSGGGRRDGGRSEGGRSSSGRSSGSRSGGRDDGDRGRGRRSSSSGRDRGGRDRAAQSHRGRPPVDTDTARGGGKPTLQRRMVIQHLP